MDRRAPAGWRPRLHPGASLRLLGAGEGGNPRIEICVRRCTYIDDYSGEEYQGIASNYL